MFNLDGFENHEFHRRTKRVRVEALAPFFDIGSEPEFEVRGLSSDELHTSMDAGATAKNLSAVVKAIAGSKEQVDEIRAAIGLTEDTPAEVRKRIEMLVQGSVEPKLNHRAAAKIAENFPIEFMQLTNEITELTGLGAAMEKPEADSP